MSLVQLQPKFEYEIIELSAKKRREFDLGMGPIGDNIFKLVNELEINLVKVPIQTSHDRPDLFCGLYVSIADGPKKIKFIGLNTNEFYDKQIFTLAHELYHHWVDSDTCVCRLEVIDETSEQKANRFAAEFLLPSDTLMHEIRRENEGETNLESLSHGALVRFIARIHCEYRLPYKAIVRRLMEISSLTPSQYQELDVVNARNEHSPYFAFGTQVNPHVFKLLNTRTEEFGVDSGVLNRIVANFESGKIRIDELANDLALFGLSVQDYGLEEEMDLNDFADLSEWMMETKEHETKS